MDQSSGLLSAIAAGEATLSATVAGVTGSTKVTITSANLVSLGVTPATPSLAKGLNQQFTAMGTFLRQHSVRSHEPGDLGIERDSVATISNAAGSRGLATTTGVGSTTVSQRTMASLPSTTLTVTAATLVSIGVTPATPSIAKGLSQQFTAVGTYTDATTQDLTATATWTVQRHRQGDRQQRGRLSRPAIHLDRRHHVGSGRRSTASPVRPRFTVSPATLVSIGVTPATPSIAKGLSKQFTAIGTYTDATTQDLTATATWASSDTDTANREQRRGLTRSRIRRGTSVRRRFRQRSSSLSVRPP